MSRETTMATAHLHGMNQRSRTARCCASGKRERKTLEGISCTRGAGAVRFHRFPSCPLRANGRDDFGTMRYQYCKQLDAYTTFYRYKYKLSEKKTIAQGTFCQNNKLSAPVTESFLPVKLMKEKEY
uniref:Uncharacterized protein n=1 Tax=Oryza nivara TaxID=4536 RepID=A0A0E0H5P4_ORYNI